MNTKKQAQPDAAEKEPYAKPSVNSWGTLRDLTMSGNGDKNVAVAKRPEGEGVGA